jgi:hypothetical protein
MKRRDLLAGVGFLAVASRAGADDAKPMPAGHEHRLALGANAALIMSAHHCLMAADVCLSHCIDRLADGDKTMADCARSAPRPAETRASSAPRSATKSPRESRTWRRVEREG